MFRDAMIGRVDAALRRHRKEGGTAESFLLQTFGVDRTPSGASTVISRWRVEGITYAPHLAMLVRWAKPPAEEVVGLLSELWGCSLDAARGLIAIEGIDRVFASWGRQGTDIGPDLTFLVEYARGA